MIKRTMKRTGFERRDTMATTAVAKKIVHITEVAGVKGREVAQLLDTTPETVSRWKSGRVEPQREKLDQLLELEWLVDQLAELYPRPDDARLWLFSRHKLLQGDTPANKIQKGQLDAVLELIAQIKDGAFI
jgi:transcriptional regulator with XRE-family HTH domain